MNWNLITFSFAVGIFASAVRWATPILLTALGEIFTERAGILNLGLEGIMLMGALTGFVGAYNTGSLWLGLLIAALTGMAMGLLMAFMSVTVKANQVVAGLGLMILGSGLSTLLFRLFFGLRTKPPQIAMFPVQPIPLLDKLPALGDILFDHNVMVYVAFILVGVVWIVLYRTRYGLALRAVGERPEAVDTRGLNVDLLRYSALLIGGALAGIGGAYLTLANLGIFWTGMTAGRGFIAVAVVVFSRWDPVRALWGALVFGGAASLQTALQTLEAPIPSELLLMLPYIATIVVLVGVSRRAEFPGAFAVPYSRGGE
ncbi:MAG TPA: ABC transporter permease [Aggregatilineaceae bacterium]|nr:ABC transporter permease [Aggregatilineaceae bacterium]